MPQPPESVDVHTVPPEADTLTQEAPDACSNNKTASIELDDDGAQEAVKSKENEQVKVTSTAPGEGPDAETVMEDWKILREPDIEVKKKHMPRRAKKRLETPDG